MTNVKVFNFASSFDVKGEYGEGSLGTRDVYFPEYAPPEILEYRNKVQNPVHKHEPKDSAGGKTNHESNVNNSK